MWDIVGAKPNNVDTVELWGRKFKRAKYGLDEEEVASFINELINERDMLVKRQEHLLSLTTLAERTVVEADNLAKQIQQETLDQAKAEANTIVAGAEEQAQTIIEEKRAEAIATAGREAEAIMANAQQQAELLLVEKSKEISSQLRDMAHRLYMELLSQLESLRREVEVLEAEFEHKLSLLPQEASTKAVEAGKGDAEFQELFRAPDQTNTREPEWELQILPPLDIMQTLEIMTSLDNLPEVEKTELIPDLEKPSIIVFVRQPIQLVNILRALPQVAEVKEDVTYVAGADNKLIKIQIALSGKTVSKNSN
jgi:F0F1-type ATP synthase membrane subunit b/b'